MVETITARGQTIDLTDSQYGDVWENKIIDFGDRNNITIVCKGESKTIRNIGFKGTIPWEETIFGVAAPSGGEIKFENIYFGDPHPDHPSNQRSIMIWADPRHAGHLDLNKIYFNCYNSNATYCSAPNRNSGGGRGTVRIRNCYSLNAHHSAYRCCGDQDVIANCCAVMEPGVAANRGLYIEEPANRGSVVTVKDVDIITQNSGNAITIQKGAGINVENVNITPGATNISGNVIGNLGSNPQEFVPSGCPTSAQEAVSGSGGGGGSDGGGSGGDGGNQTDAFDEPVCMRDIV